jgi:hypothetical protein
MAGVGRDTAYLAACRRIARELGAKPNASRFKQDRAYAAVVGNDRRNRATTEAFLCWLLQHHPRDVIAARVAANDRIGAPRRHAISGGRWSTGSLRFLQVADEIGDAPAVLEIGGGYGGQRVLCADISDYTILDLPESLAVARAYLACHGLETRFVEPDRLDTITVAPGTFCLSDYALSECDDETITRYAPLVAMCARGRITCREDQAERMARLLGPLECSVGPETPPTSRHANVVLRFSRTARLAVTPTLRDHTTALMAQRLRSPAPWAWSRWGDGEWSAILGRGTANCDGQAYVPALRDDLRRVLLGRPHYLLGLQPLAVDRFGSAIARWLSTHDLDLPWWNADVFHDLSKAGALIDFIEPLRQRTVLLVGPAHLRALTPVLPYADVLEIPDRDAYAALPRLRSQLGAALDRHGSDVVVALSAGMSAKILIDAYATRATLIDFGSVWEPYVGRANRSYHAPLLQALGGAA